MYEALSDVIKVAMLALTVVLPAIAAVFAYKKEEKRAPSAANIGHAGLLAIGGALASEHETFAYVEAMGKHTKSLDLQSAAINNLAGAMGSWEKTNTSTCEEIGKIERAMADVVDEMKKIRIEIEAANTLTRRTLQ